MRILSIWPLSLLRDQIRGSDLRIRLARGAFWSVAGTLIHRGLTLLSFILVARWIGTAAFGELGIIQSSVALFQIFASFGMATTATRYVAGLRRQDPERAGRIIGLSLRVTAILGGVMAIAMVAVAPAIAAGPLSAPHLAGYLRISAGMMFFAVLVGVQLGVLAGFEAFKTMAQVSLLTGILSFPLIVGGAWVAGLEGAVWGFVGSGALQWILGHLAVRREAKRWKVPISGGGWVKERGILLSFSLPAVLGGMMVPPVEWICRVMLVNIPDGYTEVGVFSAANHWRIALLFLPTTLSAAVLPVLSNLHQEGRRGSYKKIIFFSAAMNVAITLPLALLISLLGSWIMGFYGKGFDLGGAVLVLLVSSACLMAITASIGKAITSSGRMWWGFFLHVIWAAVYLVSTGLLVDRGAKGLALATLIAYGVHLVSMSLFTYFAILKPEPGNQEESA